MRFTLPELAQVVDHGVGDHLLGAEHEDPRLLVLGDGLAASRSGSSSLRVSRTESPERAAQAAAGMAYSACSPGGHDHVRATGRPRAAEKKRSIAAARA